MPSHVHTLKKGFSMIPLSLIFHRSPKRHASFLKIGLIKSSPIALKFISSNFPFKFQEKVCKSINRRIAAAVDGDNGVPTLTPLEGADAKKPSKHKVAAIIGGLGAALLVIVIVLVVYICLMHVKQFLRPASETASSIPSPPGKKSVPSYGTEQDTE